MNKQKEKYREKVFNYIETIETTKEELKNTIANVVRSVEELQKLFEKEIKRKREVIVSNKMRRVKVLFYKRLKSNLPGEILLDSFWKIVQEGFDHIRKSFFHKSISIFGSNSLLQSSPKILKAVVVSGDADSYIVKNKNSLKFNITKIKKSAALNPTNSWRDASLLEGFQDKNMTKDKFFIRTIPITPKNTLLTVAEFDDHVWNPITKDRESGQIIEDYMRFILSCIFFNIQQY